MNNGTDNRFRMLLQMKRRILKYKKGNYQIEARRKYYLKQLYKKKILTIAYNSIYRRKYDIQVIIIEDN